MSRIESKIQNQIISFLKSRFYWPIKIILCGENGFPDLVVIGYKTVFFVEVKSPGEEPGPLQKHIHDKLRTFGITIIVADNKQIVVDYVNSRKSRMHKKLRKSK